VVGGLLVGLGIAEVIARLAWQPPAPTEPRVVPPGLPELHTAFDLTRPNVRGIYNGALVQTNSAGFRGPERAVPKPEGVFRIAVAGDSVTMGSGVEEAQTYVALVEQALNAGGAPRYEVLNLGLIGLDISGVMARLRSVGLRFEPDLVVYGCTINDIAGNGYRPSMIVWSRLIQHAGYERFRDSPSYLLRTVWPRWLSLLQLFHPWQGSYAFELDDNYFHNLTAWDYFVQGLDELAAITRARGIPAVVFIHTWPEYLNVFHPYRRIYQKIAAAAEARGLPCIQSLPFFRGHDEESLWVSNVDGHPNAAGHRLLADALLDGLRRLPPGHLRGASPSSRATP
jgi:lysophospholipase L1-like esterase